MDLLTFALIAVAVPLAITWWVTRGWRRRFRRHPIRTTLTLLAIVDHMPRRRRVAPVVRPVVLEGDDLYRACPLSKWEGGPWACRMCNRLLPRNQTRFCGPACRHRGEDNHYFPNARAACLRRDRYACVRCGSTDCLEVNHRTPILGRHNVPGCHHHLEPGPDGRGGLEVLCGGGIGSCHHAETVRQLRAGELTRRIP